MTGVTEGLMPLSFNGKSTVPVSSHAPPTLTLAPTAPSNLWTAPGDLEADHPILVGSAVEEFHPG